MRCIRALAQVKQGQWMNWESVEKRLAGRTWIMEAASFLIGAIYDVLPSLQNLKQRIGGDRASPL